MLPNIFLVDGAAGWTMAQCKGGQASPPWQPPCKNKGEIGGSHSADREEIGRLASVGSTQV